MSVSENSNNSTSVWMSIVVPAILALISGIVAAAVLVKDVEAKADRSIEKTNDTNARMTRIEDKIDTMMLTTRENWVSLRKVEEDIAELKREMPRLRESVNGRSY